MEHFIFENYKQWESYRELNSRKSSKHRQDDEFLIGLNQDAIQHNYEDGILYGFIKPQALLTVHTKFHLILRRSPVNSC